MLDLGAGSGRNTAALAAAGYAVRSIDDDRIESFLAECTQTRAETLSAFDAALSTHALLHGTPPKIAGALAALAQLLKTDAPLYATFGSKADARYGKGIGAGEDSFAPDSGDEQGVAHAYFGEAGLRALLAPHFTIESAEEVRVDEIVGSWAHAQRPQGSVHWFVRARRSRKRQ